MFNGEPNLFATNFTGPWVDEHSFYLFFRPLTELSLISDYFLYRATPFGYHLSNLVWHTANSFLFFLFARALLGRFKYGTDTEQKQIALYASLMFSVFPTHSEPVAWILARADLVSIFYLMSSLYVYVRYQSKAGKAIALTLFGFSLLSKEGAICLPLIIFSLSFLLSDCHDLKKRLFDASREIVPYLVTFFIYLIWRFLALGTIFGGYLGSIGDLLNERFVDRWFLSGSLWQLLHPLNENVIAEDDPLRTALRLFYALAGLITLANVQLVKSEIIEKHKRQKLIIFSLIFFICSMLPNFQIWGLSSSICGGRLAYLAIAPIVLAIVAALFQTHQAHTGKSNRLAIAMKAASTVTICGLIVIFAVIANRNNTAWINGSKIIGQLQADLTYYLTTTPKQKKLAIINWPSWVDGTYVLTYRKMLIGLFVPPVCAGNQTDRIIPIDYCVFLSPFVNYQNFLHVVTTPEQYLLLVYDPALGHLIPSNYSPPIAGEAEALPAFLPITEGVGKNSRSLYLRLKTKVNPLAVQYLQLDVTATKKTSQSSEKASIFDLWNNRPREQDEKNQPHWSTVKADGRRHKLLIELGTQKRWLLSKDVDVFRIDVSTQDHKWQIENPVLLGSTDITPTLTTVDQDDNYGLSTLARDSKPEVSRTIWFNYDASKIKDSKTVVVEVSKPYAAFAHYKHLMRDRELSKSILLRQTLPRAQGRFSIETISSPKEAAVYQVRLAASDSVGHIVGTFSDPVTIKSASPVGIK